MINQKTGEIYAIDNGFACCLETIGNDPWGRDTYERAKAAYELSNKMNCKKDYVGGVYIPGWRIKPEHLKAVEDFMADDSRVDEVLRRHFGTDDMVETIKGFMKSQGPFGSSYPYKGKTDDEIKEIAVKLGKHQLEEGLKVLKEKFNEQKRW